MGRTQKELADTVAEELGLSVRTGRRFLHRILELVAEDLIESGRVELRGLGTFAVHTRPAKTTRHPKTGEPVHLGERKTIDYRSSARLRRRLNPKGR